MRPADPRIGDLRLCTLLIDRVPYSYLYVYSWGYGVCRSSNDNGDGDYRPYDLTEPIDESRPGTDSPCRRSPVAKP